MQDVIEIDSDFGQFKEMAKEVTNFYFESRYPMEDEVESTKEEIKEALTQTKKLIKLIKAKRK